MQTVRTNPKGFTLIELMIAMVIGLILLAGIVTSYRAQQSSRTTQQMVLEMQQGTRAALALMRREIRMTNYNPLAHDGLDNNHDGHVDDAAEGSVRGFVSARAGSITFTFDLNENGKDTDADESITYGFFNGTDANSDGIADAGAAILGREGRLGDGFQPLAYDIHAVAFAYAVDQDDDGQLDTYGGGVSAPIIWLYDSNGDGTLDRHLDTNQDGGIDEGDVAGGRDAKTDGAVTAYPTLGDIRAVRIWLLARTRSPASDPPEARTYVVGGQHIPVNDRYKRILLTGIVQCRNPF